MKKILLVGGIIFFVLLECSNADTETKSISSENMQECSYAMGMMHKSLNVILANNGWCIDANNATTVLKWIQKAKFSCPQDMQAQLTLREKDATDFRDIAFGMCRAGL